MLLQCATFNTAPLPISRIQPSPLCAAASVPAAGPPRRTPRKMGSKHGPLWQSCRIFRVRREGICSPHSLPAFPTRKARPPAPAPAPQPLPEASEEAKVQLHGVSLQT